ncbi:hypothetical protein, partial [Chitinimonas sp.]|uniref:hypothetical protein n=1 Tax=Chitinimonas sp. TaxID=1934313 RepID=UPI0035AF0928
TLATAASGEHSWVAGNEDPASFAARFLALARAKQPVHPALISHDAQVAQARGDYQAAIALYERAAQDRNYATPTEIQGLWECRIAHYGLEAALAMPYVMAGCGSWSYNIGVWLSYGALGGGIEENDQRPDAAEALATRYYEDGVRQFEHFFETGEGLMRDGDKHVYSMMCNNLAIRYRYDLEQPDRALPLHYKGIASSPFAEHYDGVFACHRMAERKEESVKAAEALWHYVQERGYSRYNPTDHFDDVTAALIDLGRRNEIPIWLERLDHWWSELDEEDQDKRRFAYHIDLVLLLLRIRVTQPEDALLRLERSLADVRAIRSTYANHYAGVMYAEAGRHEQAIALFEEGLSFVKAGNDYDAGQATEIRAALKEARAKVKGPWWKVW